MPQPKNYRTVIETILIVLLFLLVTYSLFQVLEPFVGTLIFALIFAVSLSTPFEKLVLLLKGRRKLAATIYSLLLIAIVVQPFLLLISTLSHHVKDIGNFVSEIKTNGFPPLPLTLSKLPLVGESIDNFYSKFQLQPRQTIIDHEIQIRLVLQHIITKGAGAFGAALQIILGIIISAFFLSGRHQVVSPFFNALKHILGKEDAESLINTAEMAIKGVSIGIMGTAFIAAVISWIGLMIAGIPFALGLSALVFFFVVIQVGPLPVWIPLIIWLFIGEQTGMAVFMIIYGIVLLAVDAIVKPVLISKSGKLPFLVLFVGVIGGMIAWGFTGMFKGAIIVAICYTVFINWLEKRQKDTVQTTDIISA